MRKGRLELCQARLPIHTACLLVLAWPLGSCRWARRHRIRAASLPLLLPVQACVLLLSLCSPAQHLSLSLQGSRPCNRTSCNQATVPRRCFPSLLLLPYSISARQAQLLGVSQEAFVRRRLAGRPAGISNIHLSASSNPKPWKLLMGNSERCVGIQMQGLGQLERVGTGEDGAGRVLHGATLGPQVLPPRSLLP